MTFSSFDILIIVFIVGVLWYILVSCSTSDKFSYLKGFYRTHPSVRMEYQDVCEKNMIGHCNLSDGTPGICVRNGICAASFLQDPSSYACSLPAKIPLPYSERDCPLYCENQELLGSQLSREECLADCRSRYYPDDY